jgi:hypothetical protein
MLIMVVQMLSGTAKSQPPVPLDGTRLGGRVDQGFDPCDDLGQSSAVFEIGEDLRFVTACAIGVARHHVERGANIGRQIDLVDQQ